MFSETADRPSSPQASEGKLADNIVYFARVLRGTGLRVGPADAVEAVRAVEKAGISTRNDFYWVLHCVFVKRREDRAVFQEAFGLFWRSRDLVEKMIQMFSPMAAPAKEPEKPNAGQSRVSESLFSGQENQNQQEQSEVEIDAHLTASGKEVLQTKDFAQMSTEELLLAKQAMREMSVPVEQLRTRRFRATGHKSVIDPRKMLANSLKTGGDLILPSFKEPKLILPPIVALADISGSMAQYSRVFLHFLHALTEERQRVHTFLFGTRLTNVTRQLRMKDPDEALEECSNVVEDWSGGTRIASTLNDFNRDWSRRVLSQGAIVLLITDGLERDLDDGLSFEMDRLHRSCQRLIWLNPLLRFEGFKAAARGIRTMLPHVDEFRPVHSLNALAGLCEALSKPASYENDPRVWLQAVSRFEQNQPPTG